MRYSELTEGINDKGIFKAMFFAGLPGAGKSTIAQRVTDGTVSPRIVNTDRSFEFLAQRAGIPTNAMAWELIGPSAKQLNKSMLTQYLNGMLPLFVDGTSANPGAALRRAGIADSLGYDTAMVWVDVSFETALKRIQTRDRKVDPTFVQTVYETINDNKEMYRRRFGANFIEVDNNSNNYDAIADQVYNSVSKFFESPVQNPIGNRTIEEMKHDGIKTLTPAVFDIEYIQKIVSVWYMK